MLSMSMYYHPIFPPLMSFLLFLLLFTSLGSLKKEKSDINIMDAFGGNVLKLPTCCFNVVGNK